ncbi:MAG: 50S ribosomal protein L19 [Dehalococcoidia bacterium]|nr:50S ribosomal protein L19 [Dehalococcoidia bacterium]
MNVNSISQIKVNPKIPQISPGDTVKVSFKVKEAGRERVQTLLGLVVRVRRGASGGNFTVRRVTYGIGVEHTFPFASPFLEKVEVVRHGTVRRAKLYYIRRLSAKEARLKERREKVVEKASVVEAVAEEGEAEEVVGEESAAEEGTAEESAVEEAVAEEAEEAE